MAEQPLPRALPGSHRPPTVRRTGALVYASLVLLAAPAAHAQLVYTLEAAGTTASYDDSPQASGFSLSPGIKLELPSSSLVATGGFSVFDGGDWTAQGFLSASVFTPTARGFRGELAATANAIAYTGHGRSAYAVAQGRLHLGGTSSGAWAGGGLGRTRSHEAGSQLVIADAGAWWRGSGLTLSASFTQSRFRSGVTIGGLPINLFAPVNDRLDALPLAGYRDRVLDDALIRAHWETGAFDFDASAGRRFRSHTDQAEQWGTLGATFWMTRHMGVMASGGRYPESYIQGFPSTHYAILGLRFASSGNRHPGKPWESSAPPHPRTPNVVPSFRVLGEGAERTIRIVIPRANRVEIMADFTGWVPTALQSADHDAWVLRTSLAPGTYRVSIRVDGGDWRAPPGIPERSNEFGSGGGIVVVE